MDVTHLANVLFVTTCTDRERSNTTVGPIARHSSPCRPFTESHTPGVSSGRVWMGQSTPGGIGVMACPHWLHTGSPALLN